MEISVFIHCPNISYEPNKTWLSVQQPAALLCPATHCTATLSHARTTNKEMHKRIYPTCLDWEVEEVEEGEEMEEGEEGEGDGESHWNQNISPLDVHWLACHIASVRIAITPVRSKRVFGLRGNNKGGREEREREEGGNRVSSEGEGVFPVAGWVDDRQSPIILISRWDDSESERGDPRLCASVRIGEAINQTTARERWCRTPSLSLCLSPPLSPLRFLICPPSPSSCLSHLSVLSRLQTRALLDEVCVCRTERHQVPTLPPPSLHPY